MDTGRVGKKETGSIGPICSAGKAVNGSAYGGGGKRRGPRKKLRFTSRRVNKERTVVCEAAHWEGIIRVGEVMRGVRQRDEGR